MPETKMWTDAHRRSLLGNFKSFIRELNKLHDPETIYGTAMDEKSSLSQSYRKLIVSFRKDFFDDIKKSKNIWWENDSEKRTPQDFYQEILGIMVGLTATYASVRIENMEKMTLKDVIESYCHNGYSEGGVNRYVRSTKENYKIIEKISEGTEFYDKKEKILYIYKKELPLEVRNKMIEEYGEDWDVD